MFSYLFGSQRPLSSLNAGTTQPQTKEDTGSSTSTAVEGTHAEVHQIPAKRKSDVDESSDKRPRFSSPTHSHSGSSPMLDVEVGTPPPGPESNDVVPPASKLTPDTLGRLQDWIKVESDNLQVKVEERTRPDERVIRAEGELADLIQPVNPDPDTADTMHDHPLANGVDPNKAQPDSFGQETAGNRERFLKTSLQNQALKKQVARLEKSNAELSNELKSSSRTVNQLHWKLGEMVANNDRERALDNNREGVIEDLQMRLAAAVDRESAADTIRAEAISSLKAQLAKMIKEREEEKATAEKATADKAKKDAAQEIAKSRKAEEECKKQLEASKSHIATLTKKVDNQRANLRHYQEAEGKPAGQGKRAVPTPSSRELTKTQLDELNRLRAKSLAFHMEEGKWAAERSSLIARADKAERERDDLVLMRQAASQHLASMQDQLRTWNNPFEASSSLTSPAVSTSITVRDRRDSGGERREHAGRDIERDWQAYWRQSRGI